MPDPVRHKHLQDLAQKTAYARPRSQLSFAQTVVADLVEQRTVRQVE